MDTSFGVGIVELVIILGILAISLAFFVLWLWMLIDCISNEASDKKLMWLLIIIFTGGIGALIYLIVRRPQRKLQMGK